MFSFLFHFPPTIHLLLLFSLFKRLNSVSFLALLSSFVVHIQEADFYIFLMYCREACRYPHPDYLNRQASSLVERLAPYQESWRDKTLQATVTKSRRHYGQVVYTGDPTGYVLPDITVWLVAEHSQHGATHISRSIAEQSPLCRHGAAYTVKKVSNVSNQTSPSRE